jgi:hypothetical protein
MIDFFNPLFTVELGALPVLQHDDLLVANISGDDIKNPPKPK